ncbi:MAG: prolyl oligopeptidase family serine peptidase, partial [Phycisphaerales bacterium]|nr:prolyl oligopeptidase family serine peptidase [Phycisphaerales bacterium]
MTTLTIIAITTLFAGTYPEARRDGTVYTMHGIEVQDPYRWLEGDVRNHEEVANWVDAQNEVTRGHLDSISSRPAIRQRVEELWNYPKTSTPMRRGDRYFFTHNDGLENQSIWYMSDSLTDDPKILLDPNTLSDDGTAAVSGTSFSPDGRWLAWARSDGGSDWKTWQIRDLETGEDLPDLVEWSKFSGASWMPDGSGFYYARYDAPEAGMAMQAANENQSLWFHRRGTPQSEDVLVHENPDEPHWGWSPKVSHDGRWLVVHVWKGGQETRVLVQDLSKTGTTLTPLIEEFEEGWSFIGNDGGRLYFRTTDNAPLGRVVSIDMDDNSGNAEWTEVIPESTDTLRGVSHVGDFLAVSWMRDATSRLALHDLNGSLVRTIDLPGIGTSSGLSGWPGRDEVFYSFYSYTTPPSIFRQDLGTQETELWRQAQVDFNPDDYVVEQVFVESKDGTRFPMTIAHRSDLERNGEQPTLLYGYGGFNIPLMPSFSPSRLAWMEMGGVLAVANLRGGGEYGRSWHLAGTKLQKQNVFDDFIAASEWLIAHEYTRPSRLAIQGGSNGGLLVGAVMTQRPELFGACLPAVGVM